MKRYRSAAEIYRIRQWYAEKGRRGGTTAGVQHDMTKLAYGISYIFPDMGRVYLTKSPDASATYANHARQFETPGAAVKAYAERSPAIREMDKDVQLVKLETTPATETRTLSLSLTPEKYAVRSGWGYLVTPAEPFNNFRAVSLDGATLFDSHGDAIEAILAASESLLLNNQAPARIETVIVETTRAQVTATAVV